MADQPEYPWGNRRTGLREWLFGPRKPKPTPPICADTGAPKWPGDCWNVRCQLGGTCCRADGVAPSVAMGNRCGCNHWTKPTCPERNCPWKGKRPVDVPPERCEHGMRWDRQCSACTPGVPEAETQQRESVIRAAVAAMPNCNPGIADDLIEGHSIHMEADDLVAVWQAARGVKACDHVRPLWDANSPRDGYVSDAEWAARKAAKPDTSEQRLRDVLEVVQQYLPPDGLDAEEAMSRITALVDPMPPGVDSSEVSSSDYRTCQFCGCLTNAKVRACCENGYTEDRYGTAAGVSRPDGETFCGDTPMTPEKT